MNPFDLKTALLAKHAQHVVLIHFPIALFMVSFAFDLLALWRDNRQFAIAAYYNLVAAAIATLPAIATGLLAWQWLYGGKAQGKPPVTSAVGARVERDDLAPVLVAHPAAGQTRAAFDASLSGNRTHCRRCNQLDWTSWRNPKRSRSAHRLGLSLGAQTPHGQKLEATETPSRTALIFLAQFSFSSL